MDERTLIDGLKKGKNSAIEELILLFGDRLLKTAYLLCNDSTYAQDLVQETFIQALDSIVQFRVYFGQGNLLYKRTLHIEIKKKGIDITWYYYKFC